MVRKMMAALGIGACVLVLSGCPKPDDGTPCTAPAGTQGLELVSVGGGKTTFNFGESVPIEFKFDQTIVTGILIKISIDGGLGGWKLVQTGGKQIDPVGGDQYQCMTYTWTIGSEGEAVNYAAGSNANCVLRIEDYNNTNATDQSTAFTINK